MYKENTTKALPRGGKKKNLYSKKTLFAILCLDSVGEVRYPREMIPAQTDYNTVPVYILAEFSFLFYCHKIQ